MVTIMLRDGQKVTPWMNYQIGRLDHDMFDAFGVHVKVRSGIRTAQDQLDIWYVRYVTAAGVRGRRVYDTRWWNGQLWYRISSAGTVAQPGTSNHEIQGNRAAVDLYDTGADAGITVKNSARGRWYRERAHLYDMVPSGDSFGEGWHSDINNINKAVPGGGGGSGGSTKEENVDCMILINGKIYALAPGFIKHCDSVAQVREAQGRGVKQYDYTGGDRLNQWARALDFYGVPRDVLSANGYVLNPESGRNESGGLWSWERANKALLTRILAKK